MPIAAISRRRKRRWRKQGRRCRRCARRWRRSTICSRLWRAPFRATARASTFTLADLRLPADLPVSLPSQLIEQRPDVRAAEEQLHSASAQIGVATANMLPTFTISANGGYINTALAHLLAPQNVFWDIAGNATQTVFDAGTLLHQLARRQGHLQRRGLDLPRHGHRRGAKCHRRIARPAKRCRRACAPPRDFERAARTSFDLANQQMQSGNANVLLFSTRSKVICRRSCRWCRPSAARLSDTAALFAALGGGWWNREQPPAEKVLDVGTGQADTVVDRHD